MVDSPASPVCQAGGDADLKNKTRGGGDEDSGDAVERGSVGRDQAKFVALLLAFAALRRGATAFLAVSAGPAEALPSYARQTGQPCAACHTAFPELTPFGRRFKIGGYTLRGGDWKGPPIAAMYMAGFTHTNSPSGLAARRRAAHQRQSRLAAGLRRSSPASFTAISARSSRSPAIRSADGRRSTPPTSATPTRSSCSARTRSGASTPTTRRPSKTHGTRRPSWGWPQISSTIAPAFGPPLDPHRGQLHRDRRRRRRLYVLERHALCRAHRLQGPARSARCRRWTTATRRPTPSPTSRPTGASRSSRIGARIT